MPDIEHAAELGSPLAAWKLACVLIYDERADAERAERLLRRAHAAGLPEAPYSLGLALHYSLIKGTASERDALLTQAILSKYPHALKTVPIIGLPLFDGLFPFRDPRPRCSSDRDHSMPSSACSASWSWAR
jgi:TPR repeat protein